MKYQIWQESYCDRCKHGVADFLAEYSANSFQEACEWYIKVNNLDNYNPEQNSIWGYKLFDNKEDASKRNFR